MKNLTNITIGLGLWSGMVFLSWLLRNLADLYNIQIIHTIFIVFLITYFVKTSWFDKHKKPLEKSV